MHNSSITQLALIDSVATVTAASSTASTTFQDNRVLPIHNWFKYSAGFSGIWAREIVSLAKAEGRRRILDPFSGSGCVALEASRVGLDVIGVDAHPFISRVAKAKLLRNIEIHEFRAEGMALIARAKKKPATKHHSSPLIGKCFAEEVLIGLNALRSAWEDVSIQSPSAELLWLNLASILREVSPVGTASWQYILPNKLKAVKVRDPFKAFENKLEKMCLDLSEFWQGSDKVPIADLFTSDARHLAEISDGWADFVMTSPPYANNYDYADALRLEMSFFEDVASWSDLHSVVRKHLICSCSQHASAERLSVEDSLKTDSLASIKPILENVCAELSDVKQHHGGKKNYDGMVARYFADMAQVMTSLRRVTSVGARLVFVIGDSAPYGVHVPVNELLETLAISSGFQTTKFKKIRDRNVKWKNRKHRVPLLEGELWVEG